MQAVILSLQDVKGIVEEFQEVGSEVNSVVYQGYMTMEGAQLLSKNGFYYIEKMGLCAISCEEIKSFFPTVN